MSKQAIAAIEQAEQMMEEARELLAQDRGDDGAKPAGETWVVRCDADQTLYMALLADTVKHRCTMKYLLLKILKNQGYPVDLAKASKDGRRDR